MGKRILIDTNAISDALQRKLPDGAIQTIAAAETHVSVVNRIEALSWRDAPPGYDALVIAFLESCFIHHLDEPVILKTIELRKLKRIKLPDAIIAATALVHSLPLYTNNIRDFSGIPGLSLVDPRAL